MAKHEYLAVGPNCWGRGTTEAEAIKEMKVNWNRSMHGPCRKKDRGQKGAWTVFHVPEGCQLDDIGRFIWRSERVDHDPHQCEVCFTEVQAA